MQLVGRYGAVIINKKKPQRDSPLRFDCAVPERLRSARLEGHSDFRVVAAAI